MAHLSSTVPRLWLRDAARAAAGRSLSEFSADSSTTISAAQRVRKAAGGMICFMTGEPLCTNLVERYLQGCGLRFFRGRHDGEYFFVANVHPRRLYVHLEVSPSFGDVLAIQVTPTSFFPAADRFWLTHFADAWNEQNREVSAIVEASTSDPRRVGILARRSQWIREGMSFEEFAAFAERVIADVIDLFAELAPVAELAPSAPPLLRDAS